MKRIVRGLALAGMVLLSACSTAPLPQGTASVSAAAREQQLRALAEWRTEGKIAIRSEQHSESASLDWRQRGAHSHLLLSGPLGVGATTLESDGESVTLRRGEEVQQWRLDAPDTLARNRWQLPVPSLHYWLKGIPAPAVPVDALQVNAQTQLPETLRQQGWTIEYREFDLFGDYLLPTRLELQRDDTRARIILRQWEFPPSP